MDQMANPPSSSPPLGTVHGLNTMNRNSTAVGGAKVGNNISGNPSSGERGGGGGMPPPAVVGNHFIKQYYGKVLPAKPFDLHRFYMDQSTLTHASGCAPEEPVSGLENIKKKITTLGLQDATVDLQCGSVDAHASQNGGVLLVVTGAITLRGQAPRQFVQTFFLAVQHQDKDKHSFFVLNDIFRFLDTIPPASDSTMPAVDDHLTRNQGHYGVEKENKDTATDTTITAASTTTGTASTTLDVSNSIKMDHASPKPEKAHPEHKKAIPMISPVVTSYKKIAAVSPSSPPTTLSTEWGPASAKSPSRVAERVPVAPSSLVDPMGTPASSLVSSDGKKTFATLAKSWATSAKDSSVPSPVKPDNYSGTSPTGTAVTRERLVGLGRGGDSSIPVPVNRNHANVSSRYTSGDVTEQNGVSISPLKMRSSAPGGSRHVGSSSSAETSGSSGRQFGGRAAQDPRLGTSIYVKPVHAGATEEDLRDIFMEFGDISMITLKPERNFAFVDFATAESATQVLSCQRDLHLAGGSNRPLYTEARRSVNILASSPRGGGGRETQRGVGNRRFVDRRGEKGGDTHRTGTGGEKSERVDGSGKFGGPMGGRGGREKGYRGGRVGRGGGGRIERGEQQTQAHV